MKSNYKNAFNRLVGALQPLCEKYNKSKAYFLRNAAWAYLKYGVTPNEYIGFQFYRFSTLERKRFFTARDQNRYEKRLNDYIFSDHFNDKYLTNITFKEFIKRDWIYLKKATSDEIKNFLDKHTKFIIKPIGLSSGRGIFSVANNQSLTIEQFKDILQSKMGVCDISNLNVLIEEFITQHDVMSSINPSSVNTIRIYSVYNNITDKLTFLSAVLRAGNSGSDVDNFHAGGVAYPINIEYGFVCGAGNDIDGNRHYFHPSTKVKMIGFQIPDWSKLKIFIEDVARVIPQGRFIGWDVAITQDGFELIEANYMADPGVMQSPATEGYRNIILQHL